MPAPPPVTARTPIRRAVRCSGWLCGYAAALLAANILTASFGMVPVGFGQRATAGTLLAGVALMIRNVLQDQLGRTGVVAAVLAGSLLSALIAAPGLALASAAAVAVAELADTALYTPLRRHGWARAVLPATMLGALLDSVVFLSLAGLPVWAAVPGQMVGKGWAIAVPILLALPGRTPHLGIWAARSRRAVHNRVTR
ncbi:VUT family protein [Streptomyces albofaciens]|uniref:VUT family protein n=1 Tax=Streptomyces albofaciens TaxID=66866 RepID=UPI001FCC843A|nr:VUT family protein [Streptomyces albofaciens]